MLSTSSVPSSLTSKVSLLSYSTPSALTTTSLPMPELMTIEISAEKYSIVPTLPCCAVLPAGDVPNYIYSLVAIVTAAVSGLFCSATTVMLLIRCMRKSKTM